MGAKYTEAQKRATAKYQKENTSLIGIRVPKEKKELYQTYATNAGMSLSSYILLTLLKKKN